MIGAPGEAAETKALLAEVHRRFLPNKVVLLVDGGDNQTYLAETNEAIRSMVPLDGNPAAYVCENFTCQAPVTDPQELEAALTAGGSRQSGIGGSPIS